MNERQLQEYADAIESGLHEHYPALLCAVLPYIDRKEDKPIPMLLLEIRDQHQHLRAMIPYVLQNEDYSSPEGRARLVLHLGEKLLRLIHSEPEAPS